MERSEIFGEESSSSDSSEESSSEEEGQVTVSTWSLTSAVGII